MPMVRSCNGWPTGGQGQHHQPPDRAVRSVLSIRGSGQVHASFQEDCLQCRLPIPTTFPTLNPSAITLPGRSGRCE